MPHLRFTRDKRGYENTYVVHTARRRGKARQRILYWFRTPPNIRVGRAALDENAIRAIEECNPNIVFDWTKILEAQPPAVPAEVPDRRRRPRDSHQQARPLQPPPTTAPPAPLPEVGAMEEHPDRPVRIPEVPVAVVSPPIAAEASSPDIGEPVEIEPPALVPVTVYHGGADVYLADAPDAPFQSKVEAQLGSEQLGRLRARYAEILARISERVGGDAARLEEMRRAADSLNPDSWVTEAEIASALQQFDSRLGDIRRALGIKRRRRSRRGGRRRRRPGQAPGTPGLVADPTTVSAASVDSVDDADDLTDLGISEPSEDDDNPID